MSPEYIVCVVHPEMTQHKLNASFPSKKPRWGVVEGFEKAWQVSIVPMMLLLHLKAAGPSAPVPRQNGPLDLHKDIIAESIVSFVTADHLGTSMTFQQRWHCRWRAGSI
jgi:hypothetical protein